MPGKPLVRERFDTRPWPVDPREHRLGRLRPLYGDARLYTGATHMHYPYVPLLDELEAAERAMQRRMSDFLYADDNPPHRRIAVTLLYAVAWAIMIAGLMYGVGIQFGVWR